jgi:hypothetical protein
MGYETLDRKIVHSAALMRTEADIEVPLMVKMPAAAGGATYKQWAAAGFPAFSELRKKAAEAAALAAAAAAETAKGGVVTAVEIKEVATA